jgi:hypothetical protein
MLPKTGLSRSYKYDSHKNNREGRQSWKPTQRWTRTEEEITGLMKPESQEKKNETTDHSSFF